MHRQRLGNSLVGFQVLSGFAVVALTVIACGQEAQQTDTPKRPDTPADARVSAFRGHPTEVTSLAMSADGSRVVSISDKTACIWNSSTGKEIRRMKVDGESVVGFSPDLGKYLIARSFHFGVATASRGTMTLRDAASGKDIWTVESYTDWNRDVPFMPVVAAVAFRSDGKVVATAGGVVKVRGSLHRGVVKTWDVETGKLVRQFDELPSRADAVAFSSDGKYLAAGTIGTSGELPESAEVHVWDAVTGQRLHTMKTLADVEPGGNPGSILQLAFQPQGKLLAAAVSDGTVRLWELPSGRELYELRGHQGQSSVDEIDGFTGRIVGRSSAVRAVAFHPNGSRLASAGYDRTVRVWNSQTGEQTATFRFDSPHINALAFSQDGQRLAAAGSNSTKAGEVVLWKWSDNSASLAGQVPASVRKDEIAKREMEVRKQIEVAVKSDESQWQSLDAAQRGVRDRIVAVLNKTATLSDQRVASAVYLLAMGRSPTDAEAQQLQKEFAETQNRPLSALQSTRKLVQTKDFNTPIAEISNRLFKMQVDWEAKRKAGGIPFLMTAEEFQKFTSECANAIGQRAKSDEQFGELAYLLTLSRFPSPTEAEQLTAYLKNAADQAEATKVIFTMLLNTKEFLRP